MNLDLAAEGHIGPHVDSIKFSGDYVVGLSLLSNCTMRFTPAETLLDLSLKNSVFDVVLVSLSILNTYLFIFIET